MGRCDSHDKRIVLLLTCHGELVEVHGKINAKSLYSGSVLKCGICDLIDGTT